jgi:hypothetical protein
MINQIIINIKGVKNGILSDIAGKIGIYFERVKKCRSRAERV